MEKPFGTDLATAKVLNEAVHSVFSPEQVFRIDHFLGKEAAQNILAFRFANGLFEPIWNRDHIDHVQIDVPETLAVDTRAAFYESTGAFRDMVVTHLFQVLAFMAMEPPTSLEPRAISEEKNKVFRSMQPDRRGPGGPRASTRGTGRIPGVAPDSQTETFIALKCEIDNWRWAGVPFYLRTGKNMAQGARIISIAFREPPKSMFPRRTRASGPTARTTSPSTWPTRRKLSLSFYGKRPGPGMQLDKLSLQFALHETGQDDRRARGLRAAHPRRHERRPHPVHRSRGHRTAVGAVRPAARAPARGPALPARLVGPARHPRPRRPQRLAPALRAGMAPGRLIPFRRPSTARGDGGVARHHRSSTARQQYQATRLR